MSHPYGGGRFPSAGEVLEYEYLVHYCNDIPDGQEM